MSPEHIAMILMALCVGLLLGFYAGWHFNGE